MNYPNDYIIECYQKITKYPVVSDLKKIIKKSLDNNPYQENSDFYFMWKEQCGINGPLLYLASLVLYQWGQKNNIKNYLFATRDCTHWYKIFTKLFPNINATYFNCSRNSLSRATDSDNIYYDNYVSHVMKDYLPNQTIFVDIHGTGVRILRYFQKKYNSCPFVFLLSSSYQKYSLFPHISFNHQQNDKLLVIVFDTKGTPIESLNFDIIGTLQSYDENGPVRDPPEYSLKYLEPYHVMINYMITKIKPIDTNLIKNTDFKDLCKFVNIYFVPLKEFNPIITKFIRQPCKH